MSKQKAPPNDLLNWLLRVPVLLIWMDAEQQVMRWQISSMADAMLILNASKGG